ncbi:MAG: ABC transporter ATP-binding protein [Rhodospirillales bacterium]|nr:MAG: ABC transporter ATP-binding protein [Rhodospirillales bacterium]
MLSAPPALEMRDLSRSFGAIAAVNAVDLAITAGGVHAVIGPNGAGKTTLLDLLSGELRCDAGRVHLQGRDVTRLPPDRRARLGLGRSFQRAGVFPDLEVAEGCRLAAQAGRIRGWRRFNPVLRDATIDRAAGEALTAVGLAGRAGVPAGSLSFGEQRQLELAMLLAGGAEVLLLDEPLAGMGAAESRRMAALIQGLGRTRTIVLVEHDVDAVFAIADTVTVLVAGRVLETGLPDAIRESEAVQEAYLTPGRARG